MNTKANVQEISPRLPSSLNAGGVEQIKGSGDRLLDAGYDRASYSVSELVMLQLADSHRESELKDHVWAGDWKTGPGYLGLIAVTGFALGIIFLNLLIA